MLGREFSQHGQASVRKESVEIVVEGALTFKD